MAAVEILIGWLVSMTGWQPALPDHSLAPLAPVLIVVLGWLLWHYRDHAVFTPPISPSVPVAPGAKPLIGHLISMLRNLHRAHDWLLENARKSGFKTVAGSIPTRPTFYTVLDPSCLEYILRTHHDTFIKGEMFAKNFGCVLGHGIFTSDGQQWHWQRKLATNIFSVKSFKQYMDNVFATKLELLINRLSVSASSGNSLDLHALMYCFTLDSFAQIGFGVDPGCLNSEEKVPFAAAFDRAQVVTNQRFWMPAWPILELLDGRAFQLAADVRVIKDFAMHIINTRRQQLKKTAVAAEVHADTDTTRDQDSAGSARDLLSLFMEAKGPDGKLLTDKQLVDTVLNFIIAGRDTTAQALSWTFYHLLHHPECESKVLNELQEVLGSTTGHLTYDQLRQLKYTKACFLEALRLNPSVPENIRFATREHILPDKSVIPKHAQIIYSAYVVNRLPAFWGDDADSFRPERWLEMETMPTPYNYLTFNAGPRLCLGQRLAELEGVYVLAGLLRKFRFKQTTSGAKVDYVLAATMPMKQGLHVYVQERA